MNESKKINKKRLALLIISIPIFFSVTTYSFKEIFAELEFCLEIKILIIASMILYAVMINIARNFKKNLRKTNIIEFLELIIMLISIMSILLHIAYFNEFFKLKLIGFLGISATYLSNILALLIEKRL